MVAQLDGEIVSIATQGHISDWLTSYSTDLNALFNINVTGTHMVTTYFLPLLRKGHMKKIGNMYATSPTTHSHPLTHSRTSTLGSNTLAPKVAAYPLPAYKISKAALNALTVQYALALQKEGFVVVAINPGVRSLSIPPSPLNLILE